MYRLPCHRTAAVYYHSSGVAMGGGLQPSPNRTSNDVILTFSDIYFELLDALSLIIWFRNCHNTLNKNYVSLSPESCSLPLCYHCNSGKVNESTVILAVQLEREKEETKALQLLCEILCCSILMRSDTTGKTPDQNNINWVVCCFLSTC